MDVVILLSQFETSTGPFDVSKPLTRLHVGCLSLAQSDRGSDKWKGKSTFAWRFGKLFTKRCLRADKSTQLLPLITIRPPPSVCRVRFPLPTIQTYQLILSLAVKDMKFSILPVLLAVAVSALPEPQTVCIASCQEIKPQCDPGYAPSGSEGCWGCCRPIAENGGDEWRAATET